MLLRRWGRFVTRHPRTLVAGWLAFIALGFSLALGALGNQALFERLSSGDVSVDGENAQGLALLAEGGAGGFSTYSLSLSGVDLADPTVARAARAAVTRLRAVDGVKSAVNPFVLPDGLSSPAAAAMTQHAGARAVGFATVVTWERELSTEREENAQREVDFAFDWLATSTGAQVSERGGVAQLVDRIIGQVKADGQRGEGIALPVSFLVMVVVFGGFVAAGLPVLGAIASIAGALVSLLGFSYLLDLDASVVNVITVLGLGLCIDYGLLIVSRFREELRDLGGQTPPPDTLALAIELTIDRAGRTVIFSALTVAISLSGLVAFDIPFLRAVSAAGVSVVLIALAVALSLMPALCLLAAPRLLRRGMETSGDQGVFRLLAERVNRTPWTIIAVVTAILGVVAAPSLHLTLTSSGAELLPKGTPERTFFENFSRDFPALAGAPVLIVTKEPLATVAAWAREVAPRPGVESLDPPTQLANGIVSVGVRTGESGTGAGSRAAVASLRADRTPFESWTVGQASAIRDFGDAVKARALFAISWVALATLVLLFLMTGSIVIPIKALVMNVLSLGATLGALVWVFQFGNLSGLLHFDSVGAIENTIPLLVLAFGFGLSMDYEVFLLSRIVELHEQGYDSESAVTLGLQRSGRIITSAALLMVIVFAGFAAADLLVMKQMGFALVVAIIIDATLVRMLLVPATMTVLGDRNWWAPPALRRLHDRFGITE